MADALMISQAEGKREEASKHLADLRRRLERIQEEINMAERDLAGWDDFLAKYRMLANGKTKQAPGHSKPDSLEVKRDSLPGQVAVLLHEHGQMTMAEIFHALTTKGIGEGKENFRTIVNTALWRRTKENDLFEKDEKGYKLRTTKFVLTD